MAKPASPSSNNGAVTVPRAWLAGLAILLVVPWLVVAAVYQLRTGTGETEAPASPPTGAERRAGNGPWGRLTLTPIVISPPLEYVSAEWGRNEPPVWAFPGVPLEDVGAFLAASGASPEHVTQLRRAARVEAGIQGTVILPPPAVVRALSSDARARIYARLSKTPLNFDQAQSFRFLGATAEEWLGGSLMSPRTRALIEPLLYRDGPFLHFADIESIRAEIADPEEMQRLAKTLLRSSTLLVELAVDGISDVSGLAEYWGLGGRRTDIRPLLESVAEPGGADGVDIVHLLPAFARNYLYRYPKITTEDLNRPLLVNCLWSSLNFFSQIPDDKFLDVNTALTALRTNYYVVEHGYQLGDIVALLDEDGDLFHVAVHLADGLVFTKNGTSPVAPWTIMALSDLTAFYHRRAETPRLIYHRLNAY
jgi:hypothetical protein